MFAQLTDNEISDVISLIENGSSAAFRLYRFCKEKEYLNSRELNKHFSSVNGNSASFVFKGNIYDMSYFWTNEKLPLDVIEALPKHIQAAVKENFNSLASQGYITLNEDKTAIICTPEGAKLCNDKSFIEEACKQRMNICQEIKKVVIQEQEKRKSEKTTTVKSSDNTPQQNSADRDITHNEKNVVTDNIKSSAQKGVEKSAVENTAKEGIKQGSNAVPIAKIAYEVANGTIKTLQSKIIK